MLNVHKHWQWASGRDSQCLMQLLICAPILKTLETQACATFRASIFKEALRRVRHTIEEIDLNGEFQCISRTEGAIGSLHDFEKLKKLSTHLAFLSPSSHTGWSESSSLLKLLPPSLESFHIRMTDKDVDRFRSQLTDPQLPFQFQWFSDPIGRLYQLLMNVALAKESGELSELRSISIDDEYSGLSHLSSKEGRRRLAAICATVGLEWRRSKRWD
ncbi:hypothetical protein BZA77DRAFT_352123 [Pyronema omphalodes]|nr:hypothetical protein BZA77DRAFT_359387 [Pyronema omphalodes]KAI5817941.1 hypothetical protein BZA77DRAFT_352123 [Pyronema omphalodes]